MFQIQDRIRPSRYSKYNFAQLQQNIEAPFRTIETVLFQQPFHQMSDDYTSSFCNKRGLNSIDIATRKSLNRHENVVSIRSHFNTTKQHFSRLKSGK